MGQLLPRSNDRQSTKGATLHAARKRQPPMFDGCRGIAHKNQTVARFSPCAEGPYTGKFFVWAELATCPKTGATSPADRGDPAALTTPSFLCTLLSVRLCDVGQLDGKIVEMASADNAPSGLEPMPDPVQRSDDCKGGGAGCHVMDRTIHDALADVTYERPDLFAFARAGNFLVCLGEIAH